MMEAKTKSALERWDTRPVGNIIKYCKHGRYTCAEIADLAGCSMTVAMRWLHAFYDDGILHKRDRQPPDTTKAGRREIEYWLTSQFGGEA